MSTNIRITTDEETIRLLKSLYPDWTFTKIINTIIADKLREAGIWNIQTK